MSKGRVAVALSGGMDSSVAAYLLKKSGYRVEGVHALLHDSAKSQCQAQLAENTCTVLDNIEEEELPIHAWLAIDILSLGFCWRIFYLLV
jgi:tRNA U34 2-thiouridine synthase MnmA/TrmU